MNAHRVYWGRITAAAAAAFALASIPAVLNGQWARFGTGTALVAIGALIAVLFFNLGRASAKAEQIYAEELAPRPDAGDPDPFNERLTWVAPVRAYDCTAITPGRPERNWRNLTTGDLAALLHHLDVPSYEADGDRGDTTVNGTHITWQPSTHTTGETR
jgi:hypothetical protein